MKIMFKLLTLFILCCPMTALAELPEAVQSDFSVVEGVVVMPINKEFIVDLDDRDNLHVGDILTLIKPGKKIFHPETREVLGSIDETLGFLQVTRIHSGYSYAKPLSEGLAPENGAPVKRFEQVPVVLDVDKEADAELAKHIQVNLPQFKWLQKAENSQALLTFDLKAKALDVLTKEGSSLHKYIITEDKQLVSAAVTAPRPYLTPKTGPKQKPLQQLANTLVEVIGGQTNEDRFAEMDEAIIRRKQIERQGIWMGPSITGHPAGMVVADLDGDGQQEIAVVLEESVLIVRIANGQYNKLAEVDVPGGLRVLSVDALDLDSDHRAELYLSALSGATSSSFVIQYTDNDYEVTQEGVRWLLRAVNLPEEESKSLVGQRVGSSENVYQGDVFHVRSKDGKLVKGDDISLPEQLNIFNFVSFSDDKGQLYYLYLTGGDYLKAISAAGDELWESSDYFGGSETCFYPETELRDEVEVPTCVRPRIVKMPSGEFLLAQNDGQRLVKGFRKFKRSRLISLNWNGFALNESWRTASQPGYLGDFSVADADNDGQDELVMAVKFKHAGLTDKARSSVVIYELD